MGGEVPKAKHAVHQLAYLQALPLYFRVLIPTQQGNQYRDQGLHGTALGQMVIELCQKKVAGCFCSSQLGGYLWISA